MNKRVKHFNVHVVNHVPSNAKDVTMVENLDKLWLVIGVITKTSIGIVTIYTIMKYFNFM